MPGIFPPNTDQAENVTNGVVAEPSTDSSGEDSTSDTASTTENTNSDEPPTTRLLTQNDEINKKLLASFLERMNNSEESHFSMGNRAQDDESSEVAEIGLTEDSNNW